jgi:hypothetical protein
MKTQTAEYRGRQIRYAMVAENGILFNTADVCRALGIESRPIGGIFNSSCINMGGAIQAAIAGGRQEMEFVEWLEGNFVGYEIRTALSPDCDDDWNLK